MMEASSRGGVRTWPNQVVTPSSSILHLSWKWNILHLHQNMESFKRRSASLIPLQGGKSCAKAGRAFAQKFGLGQKF